MTSELSILALFGLLIVVTLCIQALLAANEFGLPYLASSRDENRKQTGMGGRSVRCLDNSIVAMALFAPAILSLAVQDTFTGVTLLAAQAFLGARVIYLLAYLAGVPVLRTIFWSIGFLATAYLYFAAI